MKPFLAGLLVVPLLVGVFAHAANAGTVTRVVTTSTNECRDFTKTTTYVNRVVTTQGTACLYPDGAWHDVTAANEPIIEYEPVVVEQPAVYYEQRTRIVPVPVYYSSRPRVIYRPDPRFYDRYDHPHHYGRDDRFGGWNNRF